MTREEAVEKMKRSEELTQEEISEAMGTIMGVKITGNYQEDMKAIQRSEHLEIHYMTLPNGKRVAAVHAKPKQDGEEGQG